MTTGAVLAGIIAKRSGSSLPLRQVSAAAQPSGAFNTGALLVRCRARAIVFADTTTLKFRFPLYSGQNSTASQVNWPAGTTFTASLECPVGTTTGTPSPTLVRFLFSGVNVVTSPSGGRIDSDELPASAFGLTKFTAGDIYWIKLEITPGSTPFNIPALDTTGNNNFHITGESYWANGTSSVDIPGPIVAQGGTINNFIMMRPTLILGRHNGFAIAGLGDSKTWGQATPPWNTNGDGSQASGGPFMQGALAAGVSFAKFARGGAKASDWDANSVELLDCMQYFTHASTWFGANDILSSDAPTVETGFTALWSLLHAANPSLKILGCFPSIRTTSTDEFVTTANQTPVAGFAATGSVRSTVTAWMTTQVGGALVGTYDLGPADADATVIDVWKVSGAVFFATPEGTHANLNIQSGFEAPVIQGVVAALT